MARFCVRVYILEFFCNWSADIQNSDIKKREGHSRF